MPANTRFKEIDPALYAITILRWYAGEEPMPDWRQFGITFEQHVEVTELIDSAVANCGGYVPAHAPLTDGTAPPPADPC